MIRTAPSRVLGRLLVEAGSLDEADVEAALAEQRETRERLGEILIRRGLDPEHVARALAEQLRLPYVEAPLVTVPNAVAQVERGLALRHRIVPLAQAGSALRVAMAEIGRAHV